MIILINANLNFTANKKAGTFRPMSLS